MADEIPGIDEPWPQAEFEAIDHGELYAALREWCDWIYLQAEMVAGPLRRHRSLREASKMLPCPWHNDGPDADVTDWRTHMSIRERRVFEAAMALGLWAPPA